MDACCDAPDCRERVRGAITRRARRALSCGHASASTSHQAHHVNARTIVAHVVAALLLLLPARTAQAQAERAVPPARMTVLVDAFGDRPALHRDWGYSALVEYGGRRILFDTGNDSTGFADNARRLGVDLTRLDVVVVSHRHGDHTAGLRHVLQQNPSVTVVVADDEAFGGVTPPVFFQQADTTLPRHMRYFDGRVPPQVPHGTAWPHARFVRVAGEWTIAPGVRVVRNVSPTPPFNETPELSLVLDTPDGQVVVVGCSHPGIERIVASVARTAARTAAHTTARPDARIALVAGGLHWVTTPAAEVERAATALRDRWHVAAIAPGHCTGEVGFATLRRVYGPGYVYAGVGSVIALPGGSGSP